MVKKTNKWTRQGAKPPVMPKSVKWHKTENMLTGEKFRSHIYGRGAKNYANKIKDWFNSGDKKHQWRVSTVTQIIKNRKVKSYVVLPKSFKKRRDGSVIKKKR